MVIALVLMRYIRGCFRYLMIEKFLSVIRGRWRRRG
jgi:hypothetical protein